jgi:hypothetical protein
MGTFGLKSALSELRTGDGGNRMRKWSTSVATYVYDMHAHAYVSRT